MGAGTTRGMWNRPLTARAAALNDASTSPRPRVILTSTLFPSASWRSTVPAKAARGSDTTGRGSYSTSTSAAASTAAAGLSASTAATGSPTYRTVPAAAVDAAALVEVEYEPL